MRAEKCRNPWKKCLRTDICFCIEYKGERLPICVDCWEELGDQREW